MKQFFAKNSPLVILAGLCVVFAAVSTDFRQPRNFATVAYRTSDVGIIAVGQTLVIITAGIDLSVGSVAALSGVVCGLTIVTAGLPMVFGVMAGLLTGFACGMINGLLTTKGRIPSFIATLGMLMVAHGFALILTKGVPIFGFPPGFDYLGGARGWIVPVLITVSIATIFAIVLNFTRFGRAIFACGGNLQSARLSGIPVDRVRVGAFAITGLLAGLAGVIIASRTSIADPNAAEGYELDTIAACVIGGASLMGGQGGAFGSLAGALIMSIMVNFCTLHDFDVYWQYVLVGSLIIALVYYDSLRKRNAGLLQDM